MKVLKIFSIIIFVLLLIHGFAYINILTSEKYEVDLMQTHNKVEGKPETNDKIEAKKIEISKQKKLTILELEVLSIVLMFTLMPLIYNGFKTKGFKI